MSMTEIVINLVENVVEGMAGISSSAEDAFSTVEGSAKEAESAMTDLESAATVATDSFDNFDGSAVQGLSANLDELEQALEETYGATDNLSTGLDSIDGSNINTVTDAATTAGPTLEDLAYAAENSSEWLDSAASGADSLGASAAGAAAGVGGLNNELGATGGNASAAGEGMGELSENTGLASGALQGLIALGVASFLSEAVDAAGDFSDSWNRVAIAFDDTHLPMAELQEKWSGTISNMTSTTGRGAGIARQFIAMMGLAGVENAALIETSFEGVAAASYATGSSVQDVANKFQGMVVSGMASARMLKSLGISQVDIMEATGLSVEEFTTKFKEASQEQRAEMLSSILTTKYGADANRLYMESWGYVKDQLVLVGAHFLRLFGEYIRPIAIPVIMMLIGALKMLVGGFASIGGPMKTVLQYGILLVSGIVLLVTTMGTLKTILGLLNIEWALQKIGILSSTGATATNSAATAANTGATNLNVLSKIKNKIANAALILSIYSSNAAYTAAVGAAAAHTGALQVNTAAENQGVIARIKGSLATAKDAVVKGVSTAATVAYSAAQWALNAAMAANPIGIVIVAIMVLVGALIYLWKTNDGFRNAVMGVWNALVAFFQPAIDAVRGGLEWLWNTIQPLVAALGRLKDAIAGAIGGFLGGKKEEAGGFFSYIAEKAGELWEIISEGVGWIGEQLAPAFEVLSEILMIVAEVIGGFLNAALTTLMGIIEAVIGHFVRVIDIFVQLISGNITLGQALGMIWESIKTMFFQVFMSIYNGIGQWALNMISKALEAGRGILTGIINYIMSLPGQLWMWLLQTAMRISNFVSTARARAIAVGTGIVTGMINYIKQLPGKVYTEFVRIGERIMAVGGMLVQKAKDLAKNIMDGFLGMLGIKSPGTMYKEFSGELGRIEESFKDNKIIENAEELGSAITDNMTGLSGEVGIDMETNIDEDSGIIPPEGGAYSNFYDLEALNLQATTTQATLDNMNIVTGSAFTNMETTVRNGMNNMVAVNKKGFDDINRSTTATLSSVRSNTTKEIGNVESSWKGMQNNLVNSAKKIYTDVSSNVSKLQGNMAKFWRMIKNPASLIAGPMPPAIRLQQNRVRSNLSSLGGFAGSPMMGGFAGGVDLDEEESFNLLDTLPNLCHDKSNSCFAGWDYGDPWIKNTMSNVHGWTPNMSPFTGLKVGDFKNDWNPLKGNVGAFVAWIQDLIGKTSYHFYYDSEGSPGAMLERGYFNCWDGAHIVMALASHFGLPSSMQRGFWGSIPHVWANVAGVNIDTTAIQKGHGLMSSRVTGAGPAPRKYEPNSKGGLVVAEEINLNINLDLKNVPAGLDEDTIIRGTTQGLNDSKMVKQLVKDRSFIKGVSVGLYKEQKKERRRTGG